MDLIKEYVILASDVINFSNYDKKSVGQYNVKVAKMRQIANSIEKNYPELKTDFFELLNNRNEKIQLWTAHHILEIMSCDRKHQKQALRIIRANARKDNSADSLGEKIWLKNYYKEHPKNRWL